MLCNVPYAMQDNLVGAYARDAYEVPNDSLVLEFHQFHVLHLKDRLIIRCVAPQFERAY